MGGCVGGWVGSSQMSKNWINLDLIKIIQFCLKIYDLSRHPHPWLGVWMVGYVSGQWVWSGQITNNLINLDIIEIIQFCLKIYDLWRHPHLWVDGWVNGWAHVKSLKWNKSWPNRDSSIMDILDIFWTFHLNHLSPLWGYFYLHHTVRQYSVTPCKYSQSRECDY